MFFTVADYKILGSQMFFLDRTRYQSELSEEMYKLPTESAGSARPDFAESGAEFSVVSRADFSAV